MCCLCSLKYLLRKEDKASFSPQNLLVDSHGDALPAGAPDRRGRGGVGIDRLGRTRRRTQRPLSFYLKERGSQPWGIPGSRDMHLRSHLLHLLANIAAEPGQGAARL